MDTVCVHYFKYTDPVCSHYVHVDPSKTRIPVIVSVPLVAQPW
jgi:hypothetical protein